MNSDEQHQAAIVILHNMQFTTLASQMLLATTLNIPLVVYYVIGESADSVMVIRPCGEAMLSVFIDTTIHILFCYVKDGQDELTQQKTVYVFPDVETAENAWQVIQNQLDEWVNEEREEIVITEEDMES